MNKGIIRIRQWVKIQWRTQTKGEQEWEHKDRVEPKGEIVNMINSITFIPLKEKIHKEDTTRLHVP